MDSHVRGPSWWCTSSLLTMKNTDTERSWTNGACGMLEPSLTLLVLDYSSEVRDADAEQAYDVLSHT